MKSPYEIRWTRRSDLSVTNARDLHPEHSSEIIAAVQWIEHRLSRKPRTSGSVIDAKTSARQFLHRDANDGLHSVLYEIDRVSRVVTIRIYHYISHLQIHKPEAQEPGTTPE